MLSLRQAGLAVSLGEMLSRGLVADRLSLDPVPYGELWRAREEKRGLPASLLQSS